MLMEKEYNLKYGIFHMILPTDERTPILRRLIFVVVRHEAGWSTPVLKGSYKKCKKYVDKFNKFFEEEKKCEERYRRKS